MDALPAWHCAIQARGHTSSTPKVTPADSALTIGLRTTFDALGQRVVLTDGAGVAQR